MYVLRTIWAKLRSMNLTIKHSTVDDMLAHAGSLFDAHWQEIALNKQVMVLKPDAERYRAMESAGALLILSAYNGDELVGYSVNFVTNHLHYADLRVCSNDLLFITPEYRQGGAGLRLMRATENAAKECGARMMLWHAKPDTALQMILPRMGYGVQDIIYSTELE